MSEVLNLLNSDNISSFLTLIVALLTVVGATITYRVQKRLDREADLVSKKRELYLNFMRSFMQINTEGGLEHYNSLRMELSLLASDRVLKSVNEFAEYAADTSGPMVQRDMIKFKYLLASALTDMRRDVFDKTSLSVEDIQKTLPIQN